MNQTAQDRIPPAALAAWVLAASTFLYAFLQRVSPSVMVEDLMAGFGVGGTVLGNLSAFYLYAYAALQVPLGMLFDRFGVRRLMAGSMLAAAMPRSRLMWAFIPSIRCCSTLRSGRCAATKAVCHDALGACPDRHAS